MGIYILYCLIKDNKPCYVDITPLNRLFKRIKKHQGVGKDFDSYVSISQYKTKKEALVAKAAIVSLSNCFKLGLIDPKFYMDSFYNQLQTND